MPLLSTQAPADASKVTFLPSVNKVALIPKSLIPSLIPPPPFIAAGCEYCPVMPDLSFVNKPAVLIFTPSAMVVDPASAMLPLGAIISALICVVLPSKSRLNKRFPFGLRCMASLT